MDYLPAPASGSPRASAGRRATAGEQLDVRVPGGGVLGVRLTEGDGEGGVEVALGEPSGIGRNGLGRPHLPRGRHALHQCRRLPLPPVGQLGDHGGRGLGFLLWGRELVHVGDGLGRSSTPSPSRGRPRARGTSGTAAHPRRPHTPAPPRRARRPKPARRRPTSRPPPEPARPPGAHRTRPSSPPRPAATRRSPAGRGQPGAREPA